MAEPAFGQFVHSVATDTRVQGVGQEHRVIEGRNLDAVAHHHQPIVFQVLGDLQDAAVLEHRLEDIEGFVERDLPLDQTAATQKITFAIDMAKRDVAGLARLGGQGDTHQIGLHCIKGRGLGVEGNVACLISRRDPVLQPVNGGHRLVACRVDDAVAGRFGARFRHAPRHHHVPVLRHFGRGGRLFRTVGGSIIGHAPLVVRHIPSRHFEVIRLDVGELCSGRFGHTLCQRGKAHGLEKANGLGSVNISDGKSGNRHLYRHILPESDQLLGDPCLFGKFDQVFPALVLLDLGGPGQQGFQIAEFIDQQRGSLQADPGNARHVIDTVTGE